MQLIEETQRFPSQLQIYVGDNAVMTIPTVTTEEMREVDRLMTKEFGIHLVQMMENAGLALAEQARKMLAGKTTRLKAVQISNGP